RSVVVGNVGLLPGGFMLLPDARLDDGRLDVGILGPASPLGWGRVAYRGLTGSRREGRHLGRHRARAGEVRAGPAPPRPGGGEGGGGGRGGDRTGPVPNRDGAARGPAGPGARATRPVPRPVRRVGCQRALGSPSPSRDVIRPWLLPRSSVGWSPAPPGSTC